MKRIIIALISLALSVSIYAQEITGKWNQTHQGSENGSEMMTSETLSFMKNSTFEDVVTLEMKYVDDKNAQAPLILKVRILCGGTWSLTDKTCLRLMTRNPSRPRFWSNRTASRNSS